VLKQLVCAIVWICALPACVFAQAGPAKPKVILVKAGRVLDVEKGTYAANQGILIEGERIRQIGPLAEAERQAPKDAQIIDLSKDTVLPGLIDCHAHLLDAMDARLNPGETIPLTLALMSQSDRVLLGVMNAREDLEAGFTTVRNVGHSGIDGDVSLRNAIDSGWIPGPRIIASARKLTPPGGQAIPVQHNMVRPFVDEEFLPVNGPLEARRAVRENILRDAKLIKVVADAGDRVLAEDEMKAIVEEAHRSHVKVAVHATTKLGIEASVNAGVDSIEHGDEATDEILQKMRDNGIYLDPTAWSREGFYDLIVKSRHLREEDTAGLNAWLNGFVAEQKSLLERARKIGVKMVAGSDMWFRYPEKTRGQATLLTLDAMQKYGIPPAEILRDATFNAADLIGWSDRIGTLSAGKFADLIALDGDPLKDVNELNKVKFVMKGGAVVRDEFHTPRP
jgi:imidazolonepropionase-like amidohydrolase